MSERVGTENFDAWMKRVDDTLAALVRGDNLAGTVAVGKLKIGDILIGPGGNGLGLLDQKTGGECSLPVPCSDVDQPPLDQLPAITFHWPTSAGVPSTDPSDVTHVRQPMYIMGGFVNVTTFSGPFTIVTYVNGIAVLTANVTQANQQFYLKTPFQLVPFTDLVSVNSPTGGNASTGVVWHVQLAP